MWKVNQTYLTNLLDMLPYQTFKPSAIIWIIVIFNKCLKSSISYLSFTDSGLLNTVGGQGWMIKPMNADDMIILASLWVSEWICHESNT